jgi:radical SAM superfamily enzyme YgiQ (UPF0313 family)
MLKADFYIYNKQGKVTLTKLIKAIKNNNSFEEINNLLYKKKDRYIYTGCKKEQDRLRDKMVNWELFSERNWDVVNVRTSISCPFSCSFCSYRVYAGEYKKMNIKMIEKQLDGIERLGNVQLVEFADETLNVPPERFKDILRMMIRNDYSFNWAGYFRCQYADREMVKLMKKSGCSLVQLGIESGNNKILENMNKNATVEEYERGLALLNEYEIPTVASFIIGFPGETRKTIKDTKDFIEKTKPTYYTSYVWHCNPVTPICKEADKYNLRVSPYNWSHETMDAQTAYDIMTNELSVSIKNSIYVTSFFSLGFYKIFHSLGGQDSKIEKFNNFLKVFNECVVENLHNSEDNEISKKMKTKLENSFESKYKLT